MKLKQVAIASALSILSCFYIPGSSGCNNYCNLPPNLTSPPENELITEGEGESEGEGEGCESPILNLDRNIDFYNTMKSLDGSMGYLLDKSDCDINPDVADANGLYNYESDRPTGNGMLDVDEFDLISIVLSNPSLDLGKSGGLTYTQIANGWNWNLSQMKQDLGEKAMKVAPGAEIIFSAYILIGDADSCYIPIKICSKAVELMPILGVQIPDIQNKYTRFERYLSARGDADGDGKTNLEEYVYANENGLDYFELALDPCRP